MSFEQRFTYRCTTLEPVQQAIVQTDQDRIVLDLVDQSTGGFGIQSLQNLNLQPGQIIKLRTGSGWSECEVVHQESEQGTTRIGLRRLTELPDPRLAAAVEMTSLPPLALGRSLQNAGSPLAQALSTAVLVALGFWIAVSYPVWLPVLQEFFALVSSAAQSLQRD
jgi:hypothetical protein